MSTDNAILRAALNALATRIVEIVREGITRDELIPDELPHFRWKLTTDLKYGERGIESKTAAGDTFSKKTWLRAPIQVAGDAGRTSEYKEAVEAVSRSAGATEAQHYIFQFVVVLAKQCLETESTVDTTLLVDRSLRDLSGEAFRCGAEVWLQGLALESDEFRPAPGIVIRRPTRHDLEQEIPYYGPPIGSTYDLPDPTAVAGVELFGRAPQEVQINIEKLITLLRLFKVASVQYSSYKFFSDSVMTTFMGGAMISPRVNVVRETGYLRAHEEKRLTKFFQSMGPILPVSLYHFAGGGSDNVSIAYGRYTAALVRPAIEEELIANAVMGLEALLVREGQEVAYRLRLRAAKLFSCLEEDPIAVSGVLADAYGVRNTFSHGDQLSPRHRRRLERQYKDMPSLLLRVLDLLRKMIVSVIAIRRGKDDLIYLIDDSLISRPHDTQLQGVLAPVRDLI